MLTDLRIKIRNFIKKNKWKVILVLVFWSIIVAISLILTNQTNDVPITTYTPFEPIIENGERTPKKWQDDIEKTIEEYFNYCNNKEYEKAYEMISKGCKEHVYPTIEDFKSYVDYVFKYPRVYAIQNYSNRDNVYLYRIRIFEDILATGLTYSENLQYFEEKLVFTEKNGKLELGVKSYIGDEELDYLYEDEYMKITVTNKTMTYDEEMYTIKVQNKTEHTIVLADEQGQEEILLETKSEISNMMVKDIWREIYIQPQDSSTFYLDFQKFYDMGIKSTGIIFNNVRVLRSYSGEEEQKEKELEGAVALYSFTLPLQ